jgi:hypothetical protein
MTYIYNHLIFIIFAFIVVMFLGGCIWRLSYGARDDHNARRD